MATDQSSDIQLTNDWYSTGPVDWYSTAPSDWYSTRPVTDIQLTNDWYSTDQNGMHIQLDQWLIGQLSIVTDIKNWISDW